MCVRVQVQMRMRMRLLEGMHAHVCAEALPDNSEVVIKGLADEGQQGLALCCSGIFRQVLQVCVCLHVRLRMI